jgi:hypothetical protein
MGPRLRARPLRRKGNVLLFAHVIARSLTKVGFATYILDSFSARGLTADDVCDGPKGGEAFDDLFNAFKYADF